MAITLTTTRPDGLKLHYRWAMPVPGRFHATCTHCGAESNVHTASGFVHSWAASHFGADPTMGPATCPAVAEYLAGPYDQQLEQVSA